jgi:glycosyltransferase involved in cell wall biosynthesis
VYSKTRELTNNFYSNFIKKYKHKLKIVTPSNYSKEVILNSLGKNSPEIYVRNHIELVESRSSIKRFKTLRVAYVGSDQPHKGVGIFLELMKNHSKIEYYLFSSKNFIGSSIRYINHRTDSDNELPNLLESHDIDVVVITSQWEETFCITAYESLSAGCKVFCLKGSGNLSDLAKINRNVFVFESMDELALEIDNLVEAKIVKKNYSKYVNKMNLNYAK